MIYQNFEIQCEDIKLSDVIKEQENLKKDIERYKRINKEIKQTLKALNKTKENFELIFSILAWSSLIFIFNVANVHAQSNPKDISNLMLFVESDNLNTTNHIAYCETNDCLNESNTEGAPIADQYCDVSGDCGEGCVRRWLDQSNYTGTFNPPEYTLGRDFGQDDSIKPCYISNCINGKPCVRGGGGVPFATDYTSQDKYLEIQISDFINLTGAFSIFLLAKPVAQTQDWDYFGQSTDYFRHRYETNYLQLRIHPNTVYRVTPDNAVVLNEWQLIEIHRDALDKITVFINGIDRTFSTNIVLPGTFTIGYLFSAFKTNSKLGEQKSMHGDIASFLVYDKITSVSENINIRAYFDSNYMGNILNLAEVNLNTSKIKVHPIPASKNIYIKFNKSEIKDLKNSIPYIYDTRGRKVKLPINKTESGENIEFEIVLNNVNKGLYVVYFEGHTTKFIKE